MPRAKVQTFGRKLVSAPITSALLISLMLHFAGIASIELGRHLGWWEHSVFTALKNPRVVAEVARTAEQRAEMQRELQQQQPPPEAELVFVDVDPSQAAPEPPKDAKYYSSHSTVAANRTRSEESKNPNIDGKQDKVPKTVDTVRPDPKALQPTPPPEKERSNAEVMQPAPQTPAPAPAEPVQPAPEPKREVIEKGETLLAKAAPREQPATPLRNNPPPEEPRRRRPASVAEARAQKGLLQGARMRQSGGLRLVGPMDLLDVKATPFGTYDAMFIEAVQSRWFNLLDERDFVGNESGKVMVEFRLHYDGRITDLRVVDANVNELLSWFCQRAILDPAPYRPFPSDLRRMMSTSYREIRFTFYYNQ